MDITLAMMDEKLVRYTLPERLFISK